MDVEAHSKAEYAYSMKSWEKEPKMTPKFDAIYFFFPLFMLATSPFENLEITYKSSRIKMYNL